MKISSPILFLSVLCMVFLPLSAWADGSGSLDAASQAALTRTMQMLNSDTERGDAIKGNAKAEDAHRQVESVAGGSPEITNEIYALAAELARSLAQQHGGDPKAMMTALEQAKTDPKAFAEKLTPEQRKILSQIAAKIQARNRNTGAKTP